MKKYLYIIAWVPPKWADELQATSFSHAFITANDEADAYSKGHKLTENAEIRIIPESELLNDYVVELPHRLEA